MPLSKHFRFCLWWESFFNGGHFSTCQTRKKSTPVTFFLHMRHVFLRPGVISLRRKMTPRSIFDGGRYSSLHRHKLYHFTVANTRFTAPLTRRGKTKFATIKWYNLCRQIIQTQTCYPLIGSQKRGSGVRISVSPFEFQKLGISCFQVAIWLKHW